MLACEVCRLFFAWRYHSNLGRLFDRSMAVMRDNLDNPKA